MKRKSYIAFDDEEYERDKQRLKIQTQNTINELPRDCITVILSYLEGKELLLSIQRTNKYLYSIVRSSDVWELETHSITLTKHRFPPQKMIEDCKFQSIALEKITHRVSEILTSLSGSVKYLKMDAQYRLVVDSTIPYWLNITSLSMVVFSYSEVISMLRVCTNLKHLKIYSAYTFMYRAIKHDSDDGFEFPKDLISLTINGNLSINESTMNMILSNSFLLQKLQISHDHTNLDIIQSIVSDQLEYLELKVKKFINLDITFKNIPKLTTLKITSDFGSGELVRRIIAQNSYLRDLCIINMDSFFGTTTGVIDVSESNTPANTPYLKRVTLKHRNVMKTVEYLLNNENNNLVELHITEVMTGGYNIGALEWLSSCKNLTNLSLSQLKLSFDSNIFQVVFSNLKHLRKLLLDQVRTRNKTFICTVDSNLEVLQYLTSEGNEQFSFDLFRSVLEHCKKLHTIKYNSNHTHWNVFAAITLSELPDLKEIVFSAQVPGADTTLDATTDFQIIKQLPEQVNVTISIGILNYSFYTFSYLLRIALACDKCKLSVQPTGISRIDPLYITPTQIIKAIERTIFNDYECSDREKLERLDKYDYLSVGQSWNSFYRHMWKYDRTVVSTLMKSMFRIYPEDIN
jgi:hypothetical protein